MGYRTVYGHKVTIQTDPKSHVYNGFEIDLGDYEYMISDTSEGKLPVRSLIKFKGNLELREMIEGFPSIEVSNGQYGVILGTYKKDRSKGKEGKSYMIGVLPTKDSPILMIVLVLYEAAKELLEPVDFVPFEETPKVDIKKLITRAKEILNEKETKEKLDLMEAVEKSLRTPTPYALAQSTASRSDYNSYNDWAAANTFNPKGYK